MWIFQIQYKKPGCSSFTYLSICNFGHIALRFNELSVEYKYNGVETNSLLLRKVEKGFNNKSTHDIVIYLTIDIVNPNGVSKD